MRARAALATLLAACEAAEGPLGAPDDLGDATGDAAPDAAGDGTGDAAAGDDASDGGDAEDAAEDVPCPAFLPAPGAAPSLWPDGERVAGVVPLRLNLPLPPGLSVTVSQGPDGLFSHTGEQRFAWDFDVPLGTAVHAAAGGIVVDVVSGETASGVDPSLRNRANRVILDHGRGLFSAYVHLGAGEVVVSPGARVASGALLGHTGVSGQMTGPHLHFHVENAWSETLPIAFYRPDGGSDGVGGACEEAPRTGETWSVPAPVPFEEAAGPSPLPPGTFAEFGVVAVEGLPARHFVAGTTHGITGIATDPEATHVHLLVLPPEGGWALRVWSFPIAADGRFAGEVAPGEVGPGRYAWALAAGPEDSAEVTRSVRCVVVPAADR
jgi:hypothetical protein